MNILLVDDCIVMRSILESTLSRHTDASTFTFFTADNGLGAYNIISEHEIDIIFLDWNMPIMTGAELVDKLHTNSDHNNIKIIMATTEGKKEQILTMASKGVDGYLVKPLSHQKILHAFERVYSKIDLSLT